MIGRLSWWRKFKMCAGRLPARGRESFTITGGSAGRYDQWLMVIYSKIRNVQG
jgi:hypothetical protein